MQRTGRCTRKNKGWDVCYRSAVCCESNVAAHPWHTWLSKADWLSSNFKMLDESSAWQLQKGTGGTCPPHAAAPRCSPSCRRFATAQFSFWRLQFTHEHIYVVGRWQSLQGFQCISHLRLVLPYPNCWFSFKILVIADSAGSIRRGAWAWALRTFQRKNSFVVLWSECINVAIVCTYSSIRSTSPWYRAKIFSEILDALSACCILKHMMSYMYCPIVVRDFSTGILCNWWSIQERKRWRSAASCIGNANRPNWSRGAGDCIWGTEERRAL